MTTRDTGTCDDSKRDTETESKTNLVNTSKGRGAESFSCSVRGGESEGTYSSNTFAECQVRLSPEPCNCLIPGNT